MEFRLRMGAVAICLAMTLASLATSSSASATTLRVMDLPELVETAERVVHARAMEKRVYWEKKRIYTETTFDVLEEAKGQGPIQVIIKLQGGQIGAIDYLVAGTPEFQIGEEFVLFTYPRIDGKKHLVGLSQGAIPVRKNPETGERVAVGEAYAGLTYLRSIGGELQPVHPSARRVPLAALLDTVRDLTASGSTRSPIAKEPRMVPIGEPEEDRK